MLPAMTQHLHTLVKQGAIETVVDLLHEVPNDERTQLAVVNLLSSFMAREESAAARVVKVGAVPLLSDLLCSCDCNACQQVANIMADLARSSKRLATQVAEQGGLDGFLKLLEADEALDLREIALENVLIMVSGSAAARTLAINLAAVPLISDLLRTTTGSVQRNVVRILLYIA